MKGPLSAVLGAFRPGVVAALLLLVLLVGVSCAVAGFHYGFNTAETQGQLQLRKEQLANSEIRATWASGALVRFQAEVTRVASADRALAAEAKRLADVTDDLKRRIPDVTSNYRPSPTGSPRALPRCVFTAGFLRDYNAALGTVPGPATPAAGVSGNSSSADAAAGAGLLDSGITQADILAHVADYGERCQGLERQVNGLLDLYDGGARG